MAQPWPQPQPQYQQAQQHGAAPPAQPGYGQQWQQQQQPPQAMRGPPSNHAASPPPPPAAAGGAPAPSRAPRRQYATHQYDNSAAMPQQQQPPTHAASPSMQAAPQFFSPGLAASPPPAPQYNGDAISGQFAQMGLNGAPQPAQAQQPMQPQQPMQAPMQQQQPMQQQPQQPAYQQPRAQTQAVNLVGMQLNPQELFSTPPPPIILPPNACISADPRANAPPSYQRMTINAIPNANSLLQKSKLPLALVLSPYRSAKQPTGDPAIDDDPNDDDAPVPVVSDGVIARCRRCRTYINPFVTFVEGGQRWKCCMCGLSNEVPHAFDWDPDRNEPADRWRRPELNRSVVEFVAPTEYMVRPPQPPVYVFVLDVSYSAVNSGMLATAARTLLESLDRLPNEDRRTKVAIICCDASLHFFTVPPPPEGATEDDEPPAAQMLVVSDLDDPFLPKPTDLLVNLAEARRSLDALLDRLGDLFRETHSVKCALGAGLDVAYKLISHSGGKIICLAATPPNVGPGALKNREDSKLLGTPKESTLLQAQTGFYKKFAIDCSRAQVSVDMWLFASAYTDVATLAGLPRYTGGGTYFYPAFNAGRSEDALKFAHEFASVLAQPIALEAVMRVRASRGLRMSAFHGNFFVRSTDLLALPAVPLDQGYAIEIQLEDPLTQPFVVFQTAVLHTTSFGERRIRVVTSAYPVTSSLAELYAAVDTPALATLLADKAVERAVQSKLEDARDALHNKLIDILGTYRATMTAYGGSGASPQLPLGENMKHLPLLIHGLLKHTALRQSSHIPPDLRAYAQALMTSIPVQLLMAFVHPAFYSLHNMPKECGTVGDDGKVVLPPCLPLSSERLEAHGLYLIDNGQEMFLWIGRAAVPALVRDVFALDSYADLHSGKCTLPALDNAFSARVNAIIGFTRQMRRGPYYPTLYLAKDDGEPSIRQWALSQLIEDRSPDGLPSYQQFIQSCLSRVNEKSW